MWEWRDIFLGIDGCHEDGRTGLERARKSSLPEAQWLCKLFPENDIYLYDIMIVLAIDNSAAGNYYLFHLSGETHYLDRARDLDYPLAQDPIDLKVACEQYEYVAYYLKYGATFDACDVRRYTWWFKTGHHGVYTGIMKSLDYGMPRVIYTIGYALSTELIHPHHIGLYKEPAVMNAIKLVKDTDEFAQEALIVWILWTKLHSRLINADIRKLIVRQVWKDRIEWSLKIKK